MIVMYVASGPVAHFVAQHPTTKMLALAFLVMIGVALVADGFEFHIPRGYIYSSMVFAGAVEFFNVLARRNRKRSTDQTTGHEGASPVNKVLLVTGASRGIGAAVSKLAAARGYDVAVNYLRDAKAADAVVNAVKAAGRRAVAIQGDMAKEDDIIRLFATIDKELGRLTHLVYNSGTTGGNSRIDAVDAKTIRDTLELNVVGALLCAKAAIRRISSKHGGSGGAMVLISSGAATLGSPGEYVWYAASKGAIDSMTIGLAKELAAEGIRVNAVAPGIIATDIHPPGRLERIAPSVPIARPGTAEEVAEAVLFLLSEASAYTTGTVLRVAGGR